MYMYMFMYVYMYMCTYIICIYIYILFPMFIICPSVYFENHKVTMILLNPVVNDRIHFSVLPFIVIDPFPANDKPISHYL